jgi:hypothetical protein
VAVHCGSAAPEVLALMEEYGIVSGVEAVIRYGGAAAGWARMRTGSLNRVHLMGWVATPPQLEQGADRRCRFVVATAASGPGRPPSENRGAPPGRLSRTPLA